MTITNNTLTDRETLFKEEIQQIPDIPQKIKDQFFDYWSEPNKSRTKMRWEMEKTWDISRRLKRFLYNQKLWNNGAATPSTAGREIRFDKA